MIKRTDGNNWIWLLNKIIVRDKIIIDEHTKLTKIHCPVQTLIFID